MGGTYGVTGHKKRGVPVICSIMMMPHLALLLLVRLGVVREATDRLVPCCADI
jgi:hypothetical protein